MTRLVQCLEYSPCSLSVNYYFLIIIWPPFEPVPYWNTEQTLVLRSGSKSLPVTERNRQKRITDFCVDMFPIYPIL